MTVDRASSAEPQDDTDCAVSLAPLFVVHSAILLVVIVRLVAIVLG
jgi:hypothetical protein